MDSNPVTTKAFRANIMYLRTETLQDMDMTVTNKLKDRLISCRESFHLSKSNLDALLQRLVHCCESSFAPIDAYMRGT
jgi:hypothetical protein